jgi:hypothetical protein
MLDDEVQRGESLQQTVHFLANQLDAERQHRMELENRLAWKEKHTNSSSNLISPFGTDSINNS